MHPIAQLFQPVVFGLHYGNTARSSYHVPDRDKPDSGANRVTSGASRVGWRHRGETRDANQTTPTPHPGQSLPDFNPPARAGHGAWAKCRGENLLLAQYSYRQSTRLDAAFLSVTTMPITVLFRAGGMLAVATGFIKRRERPDGVRKPACQTTQSHRNHATAPMTYASETLPQREVLLITAHATLERKKGKAGAVHAGPAAVPHFRSVRRDGFRKRP